MRHQQQQDDPHQHQQQPRETGQLAERIQQRLQREERMNVQVAERGGTIVLSGTVGSHDARATAERIAASLAPNHPIENGIAVGSATTEDINWLRGRQEEEQNPSEPVVGPETVLTDTGVAAGVLDQPLETDETDVVDDTVADLEPPVEPDPAYFAPTDPVTGPDEHGNLTVVGGWTPTSDSEIAVSPSYEDNLPGDDALAEAVERELREDAQTTALSLDVAVENGVVHLRGRVDDLEDAEAAQDVASRVPGVVDVVDETQVAGL